MTRICLKLKALGGRLGDPVKDRLLLGRVSGMPVLLRLNFDVFSKRIVSQWRLVRRAAGHTIVAMHEGTDVTVRVEQRWLDGRCPA